MIDHNRKVAVAKAVKAEREACAEVAVHFENQNGTLVSISIADAIRARGEE